MSNDPHPSIAGSSAGGRDQALQVVHLLQAAFPTREERPDLGTLAPPELLAMRPKLIALENRDLKFFLREILQELSRIEGVASIPFADPQVENVEEVVRFLSPQGAGIDYDMVRSFGGKAGVAKFSSDERVLESSKLEEFRTFSRDQARAIVEWLTFARTWTSLCHELETIDVALAFWRWMGEFASQSVKV